MYNVVEYKSPTGRATIESYHKTQSYARLYAALNKVSIDEMSVSVVATRYPRKLLTFLKQKYAVELVESGIYIVEGDTCPTQIIVSEELSAADNIWINNLRNDLTVAQLELFAKAKGQDLPLDAYMYVVGEANLESMEVMMRQKKNGYMLSEKLDAYFTARGIAEGEARGIVVGEARGIVVGEARGVAIGEAKGKAEAVVNILRARFKKVPKETEKIILAMTDSIALDSWTEQAVTCATMKEFAEAVK